MKEIFILLAEIAAGISLFVGIFVFLNTQYPGLLANLMSKITSF
ncbi:hypothetical protein [Desulfitobacterium sp. AusDCA]